MENTIFYLEYCPYCKRAKALLQHAVCENPQLKVAFDSFEWVEESRESEKAEAFDYYYVPAYYIDSVKKHEGIVTYDKALELLNIAKSAMENA